MHQPIPATDAELDYSGRNTSITFFILFQEGEAISRAGWLLSGMRRFYPRVRKELCLAQHWYTIWTHPSGSNALEGAPGPCRAMLEGKMVAFIRLMPSVRFRFLLAYPRGAVPQS